MEQRYADVLENFRKGKYDDADLAKVEALAKELSAQFK
jgi:F-type H+-transporting ATPase subunit alpha